jgi:hypothetical protein
MLIENLVLTFIDEFKFHWPVNKIFIYKALVRNIYVI